MKTILIASFFLSGLVLPQRMAGPYGEKMKSAIVEMNRSKTVDEYKQVANTFERISKMEPTEWLPLYYVANIHVSLIHIDSAASIQKKDEYLDIAELNIAKMEKINSNEVEIEVLKAWTILNRMGLDPQNRGQSMYSSYMGSIAKAATLAPQNPRVRYMQLAQAVGEADFFGRSTSQFCPDLKSLHDTWESHKPASDIHPVWGREHVKDLLKNCK
jgi:hypothetical protein